MDYQTGVPTKAVADTASAGAFKAPSAARLGVLAVSALLALALFMATGGAGTSAAATQCSGVQVRPGDDLTKVAASNPAGTSFCIQDGTHYVSKDVVVQSGDSFVGVYTDRSRPKVVWNSSAPGHVFNTGPVTSKAYFSELDISGAVHEDACEPDCGRGIGSGGNNVTIEKSRLHHNENAGIGGMGDGLIVRDVELDNNGSHDAARDNDPGDPRFSVSAAGLKTTGTATIERVNAHDNYWAGIWIDVSGTDFTLSDSKAERNGKVGIHYEISDGPFVIERNVVKDNGKGHPDWGTHTYESRFGGMLVIGSYNGTIRNNTFGGNSTKAVQVIPDSRNSNGADLNVDVVNNALNGDTLLGCGKNGVVCSGNEADAVADATAPKITGTKPADDETGTRRSANVTATFSEEMDPNTLTGNSVKLINTRTGSIVQAEVSCDDSCKAVTIDPDSRLARKTKYKAVVTTEAQDLVGQAMEENETWTFTTGRR